MGKEVTTIGISTLIQRDLILDRMSNRSLDSRVADTDQLLSGRTTWRDTIYHVTEDR